MDRLFKSLVAASAVLGIAAAGTHFLRADAPPAAAVEPAPAPRAAKPLAPVTVTDQKVETRFAVKPKDLSAAVKKGLEYLAKNQQEDGGWNQGGGWRIGNTGGGRVEGAKVEDPSDIGNTSLALLALLRAGNTPIEGQYKDAMTRGLAFVLLRVEKSDSSSLMITDVKGTQLQSKIGEYVDTFLTALILAELKGKAGPNEKRLVAALEKTMTKIVKNQTADGGFAGNGGWAPILSVAVANKSIARAKQNGVVIDQRVLERVFSQSQAAANGKLPAPAAGGPVALGAVDGRGLRDAPARGFGIAGGIGGFGGGGLGGVGDAKGMSTLPSVTFGDAGVPLYRIGQGAGNSQDVVNSLRLDGEKARKVLKDSKATQKDRDEASKKLDDLKNAEKQNADVQTQLEANVKNESFVAGFGNNGGEEFLSFLNISETLLVKGGKAWEEWDARMVKGLEKAQDKDGSWQGHHCITGKTFCTAGALLVLMADRTQFPAEVLVKPEAQPAAGPDKDKK
jgi:hypothetical protein